MPNPIVIVHGWSDHHKSFVQLAKFLTRQLKTRVTTIDLADWVSLNDSITYRDLRHAMQRAWTEHKEIKNKKNVHLVSHSTGALVVRDWMTRYYKPETVPIRRHLMLAPANFGSQLAHKGRAWLGRVFKGWKSGFETGERLLYGLELGSPYTWALAEKDLFGTKRWYGPDDRILATVIVGNSGYGGIAAATDEVGGDGTVRVATANLDAARLSIDYTNDPKLPEIDLRLPLGRPPLAFGISDGDNHSSVAFKKKNAKGEFAPHGPHAADWILRALTTTRKRWPKFVKELADHNHALYKPPPGDPYFHGFQNTVLRVRDHLDNPVDEFLLEFTKVRRRSFNLEDFGALFQREVINKVHNYAGDRSHRCFFIDVTALRRQLGKKHEMWLELEALPEYKPKHAVGYGRTTRFRLEGPNVEKYFVMNRTLLVDVRVRRIVGPQAFRLIPARPLIRG